MDRDVAHCGLMIAAGSRDEEDEEHGLAHFLEHCFFKGTKMRKNHHILSRLDAVGGELNAFTAKEEIAKITEPQKQLVFNASGVQIVEGGKGGDKTEKGENCAH